MMTLVQYNRPKKTLSYSPFCLKLETYFKMAQVPYQNKFTVSVSNTTKKKLPVVLDEGTMIEDSGFIIDYLKQKYGVDLDAALTEEQKSISKAFQWLCEKSIVDIIMYFRWADSKNWNLFRNIMFAGAPWIIKVTAAQAMAKSIKKNLWEHGIGRFTDEEKLQILHANLKALSNYLGDKKYFFNHQASSLDAIVFAHLVQLKDYFFTPQFNGVLESYPNLKQYVAQIEKTYWNDL